MKLFSGPLSMFGAKAQIAALEKSVAFELVMVPFDRNDAFEPKHPEVIRIDPKRQVPVLVVGDVELFDSTQIFDYLEDLVPSPPLLPTDVPSRARARQLEHLSDEVFLPHVIGLMGLQHDMQGAAAVAACERVRATTTTWTARWNTQTSWPARAPLPTSPSTWRASSPTARARS